MQGSYEINLAPFLYGKGNMSAGEAWITAWIEALYLINNYQRFPHLIKGLNNDVEGDPFQRWQVGYSLMQKIYANASDGDELWKEFKQLRQEVAALTAGKNKMQIFQELYDAQISNMQHNQKITLLTTSELYCDISPSISSFNALIAPTQRDIEETDSFVMAAAAELGIIPQNEVAGWLDSIVFIMQNYDEDKPIQREELLYQLIAFGTLAPDAWQQITEKALSEAAEFYAKDNIYEGQSFMAEMMFLAGNKGAELAAIWFNPQYKNKLAHMLGIVISKVSEITNTEPEEMLDFIFQLSPIMISYWMTDIRILTIYDAALASGMDYVPQVNNYWFEQMIKDTHMYNYTQLLLNKLTNLENTPPIERLASQFNTNVFTSHTKTFIHLLEAIYDSRVEESNFIHL